MRLFISIDVSKELLEYSSKIQKKLFVPEIFKGSFVKTENLHITLIFLGEVEKEKVELIKNIINLRKEKFFLKINSLNIDNLRNPKVVWFDFEKNIDFENYVQELRESLIKELEKNLSQTQKQEKENFNQIKELEENFQLQDQKKDFSQDLLKRLKQDFSSKEFKAHLTLVRVRKIYDKKKFDELICSIKIDPIEFISDKITLKETKFVNSFPEYTDLYVNFLK